MQLYYCHYRVYVFEWTGTEKKIKRRGHNGLFSKQQIGGQKQNGNLLKGSKVKVLNMENVLSESKVSGGVKMKSLYHLDLKYTHRHKCLDE
ncbi:hypothetical protein LXL04_015637 [Taraxacum kok-saghyz]